MNIDTSFSMSVSALVKTELDYAYLVEIAADEISLDLIESVNAESLGTVTFGSVEEMRAVAQAMLKLADSVTLTK